MASKTAQKRAPEPTARLIGPQMDPEKHIATRPFDGTQKRFMTSCLVAHNDVQEL